MDEAVSGYSLTKGSFRKESQVEFATGESAHLHALSVDSRSVHCFNWIVIVDNYVHNKPVFSSKMRCSPDKEIN